MKSSGTVLVSLVWLLFVADASHAQWTKTASSNNTGVIFVLHANERGGEIDILCSPGKFKEAWLITDKIAELHEGKVNLEYRRDNESKPHGLRLLLSEDRHRVLLQREEEQFGIGAFSQSGFEQLLYGPLGFGGGAWRKNKKVNYWAHHLTLGFSVHPASRVVYTFDVPDPSPVREACGIH